MLLFAHGNAGNLSYRWPKMALFQRRLMSDRMWDGLLRTQFPQPGRG